MSVGIVGAGKMGSAIGVGWLKSNKSIAEGITAQTLWFVEPNEQRRQEIESEYGCHMVASVTELPAVDIVVLAVKPQGMFEMLAELTPQIESWNKAPSLIISIAAGLTTQRLLSALPDHAPLVRVMPNLPLSIGEGASGICASANSTAQDVEQTVALFSCLGVAQEVPESLMDAVGAISGSGPAYVAWLLELLRSAGAKEGLDPNVAESLALQTLLGTALLLKETGEDPTTLRKDVCSPGGTTLAALAAMKSAGFDQAVEDGVEAAVKRSKELAQDS